MIVNDLQRLGDSKSRANHRAKRAKKNRAISENKSCIAREVWYSLLMNNTYIVESQSASGLRACLLGSGSTEAAAWADAFGPRPWTASTKRAAREAWVRAVSEDEFEKISYE